MILGKIANIQSGLVLSRKAASTLKRSLIYKLLTVKNITANGTLNTFDMDDFYSFEELNKSYLTQKGDIVVRLTHPYTALYIASDFENLLISSNFCIIRLLNKKVNPQYLQWFLNTDYVKIQISKNAMGTVISAVRTSFFKELDIKVPSIEKQEAIIRLNDLHVKEQILLEKLKDEKELLYKKISNEILKKL